MIPEPAAKVPLETDALVTAMLGIGIVLVPTLAVVGRSSVTVAVVTLYVLFQPAYLVAKSIRTEKEGEESEGSEAADEAEDEAAESQESSEGTETESESADGDGESGPS